VRLVTAGFWEMRFIAGIIAACFTLHVVLVRYLFQLRVSLHLAQIVPALLWEGSAFFASEVIQSGRPCAFSVPVWCQAE